MKLGVISDLHSNVHALDKVLAALQDEGIDHLLVLGDLFGYYPWALETWALLEAAPWPKTMIKGNHDAMLLRRLVEPEWAPAASYADSIIQNLEQLRESTALQVLGTLSFDLTLDLAGHVLRLAHGTPDDPENGRCYPDVCPPPPWLPGTGQWLFLGHTHYPMALRSAGSGWLINPGSVGQPRDGNPQAAYAVIDLTANTHAFRRIAYDVTAVQELLRRMGWDERAIRALDKRKAGSLDASP